MNQQRPQLLVSDIKGKIYNIPYLESLGMKGGRFFRLTEKDLIKLPYGSELFMLPDRAPVGYNPEMKKFVELYKNPVSKRNERCFAVAAFGSPGFTITYNSAYVEINRPGMLPLFSYGAAAFYKGEIYITCLRTDRELRQDLRYMDINLVRKNVSKFKKIFCNNRLVTHLETCALSYGCPTAKNFFLSRYEASLPTSPSCNAQCMGCISYQPNRRCSITQPRITFVPTPQEIEEIALFHINNVKDPIVSFGQGCEGEPLLAGDVIERAIRIIRKKTNKGMVNLNTNASKPEMIACLFDAGLDSIRVSLNSVRPDYYMRYYKPGGYTFTDVMRSIKVAKKKKGFVSINYLIMPGFTDSKDEMNAFKNFIETYCIDMIQWRNLNFDPLQYFRDLKVVAGSYEMCGIREVINSVRKKFPELMMGYFNPSRYRISRNKQKISQIVEGYA